MQTIRWVLENWVWILGLLGICVVILMAYLASEAGQGGHEANGSHDQDDKGSDRGP